jgi:hypothetical protein
MRRAPFVVLLVALTLTGTATAQQDTSTVPAERYAPRAVEVDYTRVYWDVPASCREREHAVWKEADPKSEIRDGLEQMRTCRSDLMEARAEARAAAAAAAAAQAAAEPTPTTAPLPTPAPSGGCPSYMAGESSSPTATNPSSGAYGCFQVIPSTAAAHDCDLSSLAGQYECAGRICETSGDGAWVAADPCGSLGTRP